ncbi:uncharacterized protein B0I36DRAFT_396943 [Microdochium trichocladiopsis]|uniref:Uncharacterized protein n=1 Tax=Microdochium trichocladiopsis TaxID=1682393 RepID=A0A9P8XV02_9PEZI|nr:uncharacterized protein B0I36DRAFT_396943 [Microdochium trichocladiopsis]KAH7016454.1 hypothetical protein B0I36DRAFT_396943 [Microdochium trichocladiopsis]
MAYLWKTVVCVLGFVERTQVAVGVWRYYLGLEAGKPKVWTPPRRKWKSKERPAAEGGAWEQGMEVLLTETRIGSRRADQNQPGIFGDLTAFQDVLMDRVKTRQEVSRESAAQSVALRQAQSSDASQQHSAGHRLPRAAPPISLYQEKSAVPHPATTQAVVGRCRCALPCVTR